MVCDDCKNCGHNITKSYPGLANERAQCFTQKELYALTSVLISGFERCPWPAYRKEMGGMKHFYRDVPKLGNVALSRYAQDRAVEDRISEEEIKKVLFEGRDRPDGQDVLWRERCGVRLVVLLHPVPDCGAWLVTTLFRVLRQATTKGG